MNKKVVTIATAVSVILGMSIPTQAAYLPNSGTIGFVNSIYESCLNRAPNTNERLNTVSQLNSGELTGKQMTYNLFFSTEFANRADDLSDKELINIYYDVFLDREATNNEIDYWTNQIDNTEDDIEVLYDGFSDSEEFAIRCENNGIEVGINPNTITETPIAISGCYYDENGNEVIHSGYVYNVNNNYYYVGD